MIICDRDWRQGRLLILVEVGIASRLPVVIGIIALIPTEGDLPLETITMIDAAAVVVDPGLR